MGEPPDGGGAARGDDDQGGRGGEQRDAPPPVPGPRRGPPAATGGREAWLLAGDLRLDPGEAVAAGPDCVGLPVQHLAEQGAGRVVVPAAVEVQLVVVHASPSARARAARRPASPRWAWLFTAPLVRPSVLAMSCSDKSA